MTYLSILGVLAQAVALGVAFTNPPAIAEPLQTPPAPKPSVNATLAIVGGRLVDGYGGLPLENAVILVNGNTIVAIGQVGQLAVPAGARIVEADGMTVLPGLWESHGHLQHVGKRSRPCSRRSTRTACRKSWPALRGSTCSRALRLFATLVDPWPSNRRCALRSSRARPSDPACTLRVRFSNQRDRSQQGTPGEFSVSTPAEARAAAERLIAMKVDQIKVYGFWDLPVLAEVTDAAHRAGIWRGRRRAAHRGVPNCGTRRRRPAPPRVHGRFAVGLLR